MQWMGSFYVPIDTNIAPAEQDFSQVELLAAALRGKLSGAGC
jgi:hypothetical protein